VAAAVVAADTTANTDGVRNSPAAASAAPVTQLATAPRLTKAQPRRATLVVFIGVPFGSLYQQPPDPPQWILGTTTDAAARDA
jgi:hypothetical protein